MRHRCSSAAPCSGLPHDSTPRSWHGRILGAAIAAPHAGELIQPWCLAIAKRLKISSLAGFVPPYPTLGEASKRAAGSYFTEALFGPRTRWLVRLLSRLPVW